MPPFDAHLHAFRDDRTERASLDRINQAKEHWRAYVQGRAELELIRNKLAIEQAVLLSKWRAEDRALRSSRARPVVCVDCGVRNLEHFYTSRQGEWLASQWRERSSSTSRTQANNPGSLDEEAGHCQKAVTLPNMLRRSQNNGNRLPPTLPHRSFSPLLKS